MPEAYVTLQRDVLRSWLKVSGYSNVQLAEALQVSRGRISQLMNDQGEPSARLIAGLLHITNLPFDRLFSVKEQRAIVRRLKRLSQRRINSKASGQPIQS